MANILNKDGSWRKTRRCKICGKGFSRKELGSRTAKTCGDKECITALKVLRSTGHSGEGTGRPTIMGGEILKKLEEAFSYGCTDLEACLHAGINPENLYNYQKHHPEFIEKKTLLKEKPVLKARNTIVNALNMPQIAQWYITKKRPDEFNAPQKMEVTGKDGGPVQTEHRIIQLEFITHLNENPIPENV
nr:MAG: terminase small subunit [Podoviridae sp. ctka020]